MDYQTALLQKFWKTGLMVFAVVGLILAGLFLNLRVAGATESTASATQEDAPTFPNCVDKASTNGDKAHWDSGLHQIVGNGLLEGRDDVYSLEDGNYLQCFRGDECIQTNWWRTDAEIDDWYSVNGTQWNLDNHHYSANNINYDCNPEPSPSPTPTATPTSCNNCGSQEQHQEQSQEQTININVEDDDDDEGEVESATIVKQPDTGVGILGMTSIFSAAPLGVILSRFAKGKKSAKKEENLSEIATSLVSKRKIS